MKYKILIMLLAAIFIISIIPAGLAYTDSDVENVLNKVSSISQATANTKKADLENIYGKGSVYQWYRYLNPDRKANCPVYDFTISYAPKIIRTEPTTIPREKVKNVASYFFYSAEAASKNNYGVKVSWSELYTVAMGESFMTGLESIKDKDKKGNNILITETPNYFCNPDLWRKYVSSNNVPALVDPSNSQASSVPIFGLTSFSDSDVATLKSDTFLRKDFGSFRGAFFNTLKDGVEAFGAHYAWSKWKFLSKAAEVGIDTNKLSDEQIFFWSYIYYNSGGYKIKYNNQWYYLEDPVNKGRPGNLVHGSNLDDFYMKAMPGQTITNGVRCDGGWNNAMLKLGSYKLMKELGIFTP